MKRIKEKFGKILLKFNLISVFFFALSIVSMTFAWFAFSNITKNNMEIGIKAWNIEISDENGILSNNISVSLEQFFPGCLDYSKSITIYNSGDLDAFFSYKIKSLRILDETYDLGDQELLLDQLSQEYPFSFNFVVDSNYLEKGKSTNFDISISWPLDSGNDINDSSWGKRAYDFILKEKNKKELDSNYDIRSSIELEIELNVEQYVASEQEKVSDNNYHVGKSKLLNINDFSSCSSLSDTCLKFYVLESNNLLSDVSVTYILDPKLANNYVTYNKLGEVITNDFSAPTVEQLLKVVSFDIYSTKIVIPDLSKRVLGKIDYPNRLSTVIDKVTSFNGAFSFSPSKYSFLDSTDCYWTSNSYSETKSFALKRYSDSMLMYGELKDNSCKFVPVITIKK